MKYFPVKQNFIYPEINEIELHLGGAGQGDIIRPNGDWRDYVPRGEEQRRHGVESSACFVEAQQHTIATLQEEKYGIKDSNFSARYTLIHSDASPNGGSPLKAAVAIKEYGLIPDSMLPFSDDIKSWEEFNSFKGGNENLCDVAGSLWRKRWKTYPDVVVTKNMTIETKYARMREALKSSPVAVSVFGWLQDNQGEYIKPKDENDNHLVELLYIDEQNCPYILDTYYPYLKRLGKFYDFDFGMKWTIEQLSVTGKLGFWEQILNLIKGLWKNS